MPFLPGRLQKAGESKLAEDLRGAEAGTQAPLVCSTAPPHRPLSRVCRGCPGLGQEALALGLPVFRTLVRWRNQPRPVNLLTIKLE